MQETDYLKNMCAKSLQWCPTLQPYGLLPARLLCPWDPPGKNTGVGYHFLLQEIFWTQGSTPLLHWQAGSYHWHQLGNPFKEYIHPFPHITMAQVRESKGLLSALEL